MLELSSTRWAEFDSFLGEPSDLPRDILAFSAAAGAAEEAGAWAKVRDYFLCQGTIKATTAQAAVPHVAPAVARMTPSARLQAVVDLGLAEGARLQSDGGGLDAGLHPDAYLAAIRDLLRVGLALVPVAEDPQSFRYLLSAVANLSGHARFGALLFTLDGVVGACPKCGSVVDSGDIPGLEYL